MGSRLLRLSCEGGPAGARDVGFFVGLWDETHQRGEPDLVVNADHSYQWLVALDPDTVVEGSWHEASADQLGGSAVGPGIVLEHALDDRDWVVKSEGDVDGSNRESILAEDDNYDIIHSLPLDRSEHPLVTPAASPPRAPCCGRSRAGARDR